MKPPQATERPSTARPGMPAGEDAPAPQAGPSAEVAPVCPLIPGRFKYTCSGRCKGCDEERDHRRHASA